MTEINKLKAWMDQNEYTIKSLAGELGIGYYGVYLVLHRERVSPGFRLRFESRFGKEVGQEIFEPLPIPQSLRQVVA